MSYELSFYETQDWIETSEFIKWSVKPTHQNVGGM